MEEQADTRFYVNIESLEGHGQIGQILGAGNLSLLEGIVLGRTDLRSALKLPDIDGPEMLEAALGSFAQPRRNPFAASSGGITE